MSEKILNDDISRQVLELFDAQLVHPVEILFFSKNDPCESCKDTHQLLLEVTSISEQLHLSTYNVNENPDLAQQYKITLTPGLVIVGRETDKLLDYGIRFSGIPSGYEFSSLIQAIILVSKRDSGLKHGIRDELKSIINPVNLKVFVTPT